MKMWKRHIKATLLLAGGGLGLGQDQPCLFELSKDLSTWREIGWNISQTQIHLLCPISRYQLSAAFRYWWGRERGSGLFDKRNDINSLFFHTILRCISPLHSSHSSQTPFFLPSLFPLRGLQLSELCNPPAKLCITKLLTPHVIYLHSAPTTRTNSWHFNVPQEFWEFLWELCNQAWVTGDGGRRGLAALHIYLRRRRNTSVHHHLI